MQDKNIIPAFRDQDTGLMRGNVAAGQVSETTTAAEKHQALETNTLCHMHVCSSYIRAIKALLAPLIDESDAYQESLLDAETLLEGIEEKIQLAIKGIDGSSVEFFPEIQQRAKAGIAKSIAVAKVGAA